MKKISSFDDLYRYTGNKKKFLWIKNYFFNPGFRIIALKRMINNKIIGSQILKVLYRFTSRKYHFQIPINTKIEKGFYIGHYGRIIINPKSVLGKNINIATGVVIGQVNRGVKEGVPVIGDEVWIGANCVIVGKIFIGNNVLISPNSFVNFNVPDNSIVIGNKIIYDSEATKDYINKKV